MIPSPPSLLPSFHLSSFRTSLARALMPSQQVLAALVAQGGTGAGGRVPRLFASLSELSRVHKACQETCAMSLTRVWMSCRHRGHVSSCKAHSMHIPLGGNEGEKRQAGISVHKKMLLMQPRDEEKSALIQQLIEFQ